MSLVVAYKKDGIIYMGADTQSTLGSTKEYTLNESGYKISRLKNGILVGVCGRVKGHQKILFQKRLFDVPEDEVFDKRYIVKNIVPKLSELIKDLKDDDNSCNSDINVTMLAVRGDRMYRISRYLEVLECGQYAAIGAGFEYAMYELSRIRDDVEQGLLRALRAGANFESTVSAPFILINSKELEYKLAEA